MHLDCIFICSRFTSSLDRSAGKSRLEALKRRVQSKELLALQSHGRMHAGSEQAARKRALELTIDSQEELSRRPKYRHQMESSELDSGRDFSQSNAREEQAHQMSYNDLEGGARGLKRDGREPVQKQEADGHVIFKYGGLFLCRRCGAYSEHRVRKLARECPGEPPHPVARRKLGLLIAGRHPIAGTALGFDVKRLQHDGLVRL